MKKLLITIPIGASLLSFAAAQGEPTESRPAVMARPVISTIKATMASGTQAMPGVKAMMLEDGVPLTGDQVIDGKIKALVKERNEKIKAVQDDFHAKLRSLVGEKKQMIASTTAVRKDMREDMKTMRASGTPAMPIMNASGTKPTDVKRPNPIRKFFQSFFGSSEALAEQAQQ